METQGCARRLCPVVPGSAGMLRQDTKRCPNDPLDPHFPTQLESFIQSSVRPEMAELQQTAVQNQTATMLELGSSLLNRSTEQSRKLTDVEAQVWHVCPHVPTTLRLWWMAWFVCRQKRFPEVTQDLMHQWQRYQGCVPQTSQPGDTMGVVWLWLLMPRLPSAPEAGAESDVADRDAAPGEFLVHHQAGEAAAAADQ